MQLVEILHQDYVRHAYPGMTALRRVGISSCRKTQSPILGIRDRGARKAWRQPIAGPRHPPLGLTFRARAPGRRSNYNTVPILSRQWHSVTVLDVRLQSPEERENKR